jgi:hypothetical protein
MSRIATFIFVRQSLDKLASLDQSDRAAPSRFIATVAILAKRLEVARIRDIRSQQPWPRQTGNG